MKRLRSNLLPPRTPNTDILRGHIIEGAQFGKLISMRSRLKTMNSDHFIEARVIKRECAISFESNSFGAHENRTTTNPN